MFICNLTSKRSPNSIFFFFFFFLEEATPLGYYFWYWSIE